MTGIRYDLDPTLDEEWQEHHRRWSQANTLDSANSKMSREETLEAMLRDCIAVLTGPDIQRLERAAMTLGYRYQGKRVDVAKIRQYLDGSADREQELMNALAGKAPALTG